MKRFIKSAIACVAAVAMMTTVASVTTQAATKKTVTVTTQAELNKAIKDGAKNIVIKAAKGKIKVSTTKAVNITISKATGSKAEVVINAKKANIKNNATVKSITIQAAEKFTENGKGNDIVVATAPGKQLNLTVAKGSKVGEIKVAKEGADVKIVANGSVESVAVAKSDANVVINGTSNSKIDVTISKPGAKVATSVPVDLTANRKATVVIAKGADNSTVTANASLKVSVAKGATVASVDVKADANVSLIAKGTVTDVTVSKEAEGASLNINAFGKVANVTVDAKADVAVKGSTTEAVKVTVNAADTTVKAETKIETTLNADAKIDFAAGAEGSKVIAGKEDVKVEINNGTSESITTVDSTGKESTVEAGKSETTTENKPATGGNTGSTGGSNPSSDPNYTKERPAYIKIAGREYRDGDKITVTEGINYTGTYDKLLALITESLGKKAGQTVTYKNEADSKEYTAVIASKNDTEAKLLYTGNKNEYLMTIIWLDSKYYEITWKKAEVKGEFYSKTFPEYIVINGKEYPAGYDKMIPVFGDYSGSYADLLELIQKNQNVTKGSEVKYGEFTAKVTSVSDDGSTVTLLYDKGQKNDYSMTITWNTDKPTYKITWSSAPKKQASTDK